MANQLLEKVWEAHGGLDRWKSFEMVHATIVSGGQMCDHQTDAVVSRVGIRRVGVGLVTISNLDRLTSLFELLLESDAKSVNLGGHNDCG